MNNRHSMSKAALVTAALYGSVVWAATLHTIEPLSGDTSSEGRAITPDGKYVAGLSGTNRGIFWSSYTLGTYRVGNAASSHTLSTGIGYRTVAGGRQVVVGGNDSSGWVSCFGIPDPGPNPPPNDWLWRARDANTASQGANPRVSPTNCVAGTGGVNWYFIHDRDSGSATPQAISIAQGTGDPNGTMTGTYGVKQNPVRTNVRAVSGTGRAVAARRDGSTTPAPLDYRNVYYDYVGATTPSQTFFKGLKAGTSDGEAWSISLDGTKIGGMAVVDGGRSGQWPYRYDVPTDTIVELPTYPDTGGSTTNGIVYGLSADGSFASGQNFRGQERAVLWDLRDADPANWKVYDLTSYFAASGQLGNFTRLSRGYNVGVDTENGNVVVTGTGATAAGTRGFVAMIPLADFPLPDTGACCVLGACSTTFAAACPDIPGQQRFTPNRLCANAGCPGACCNNDGHCSDFVEAAECTAGGGIPRAAGSTCATSSCAGACCLGFQACEQANYGACPGSFAGIGVACETAACPCTAGNFIWADADHDGDVDHMDFGAFQLCFTGADGGVPAGCQCFDRAAVNPQTIDPHDLDAFTACMTGPGVPFDVLNPPAGCVVP
ncbi:MAG: hypothetical protein HRF43_01760 [Phycisphaerae bacterium]|jgi:hypothetical protein